MTHPLKLSVLTALAVLCIPSATWATQPNANGNVGTLAQVSSSGAMSIGDNGSALSYASSSQSAYARTMAATACLPGSVGVNASMAGETATRSAGMAYNTSTGAGTGSAIATGSVSAAAQGTVGIQGLHTGVSGGQTSTQSTFAIQALRDQGSSVQGHTASGFETVLRVDRSSGVTVQAATTGYVTGANTTSGLAGLNPASVTSIQSSGTFSSVGRAGVGASPRP